VLLLAGLHKLLQHLRLGGNRLSEDSFELRHCGVQVGGEEAVGLSGCIFREGNLGFGAGARFLGDCGISLVLCKSKTTSFQEGLHAVSSGVLVGGRGLA
jgi:hypothetical protein